MRVVAGDTLYELSEGWGTTAEEILPPSTSRVHNYTEESIERTV